MVKKVIVNRYVNPHYHAGCNQCTFSAGIHTEETPEPKDVIRAVKKHVKQSGHSCWVEAGTRWDFSLDDNDEA